jgi:Protein of unknown function (DUF2786)
MTDQQKYAEKIAGLLRKAESTTPEEAELLFAKATELMAKYAIDEAMLRSAGQSKTDDEITQEEFVTIGIYRHALYWIDIYALWNNGCELYEITRSGPRTVDGRKYAQTRVIVGHGFKSDLDAARLLATSLKLQCIRAEAAWWRDNSLLYSEYSKGNQHAARRGFMLEFANGANSIMKIAFAKAKEAAEKERGEVSGESTSVAIALRDKGEMVRHSFEQAHPHLRSGRTSRMMQGDFNARQAGYAAGQRADVGQPKAGSGQRKQLS